MNTRMIDAENTSTHGQKDMWRPERSVLVAPETAHGGGASACVSLAAVNTSDWRYVLLRSCGCTLGKIEKGNLVCRA